MTQYKIETQQVHGGYDLIISDQVDSATLFIQDKAQAKDIADKIILIATQQSIGINAAFTIFNQSNRMFPFDENE